MAQSLDKTNDVPDPTYKESPTFPELQDSDQEKSTEGFCPVVGIGASAGGLEAFAELIQSLPDDSGMAFVLVQHLDPHHESFLAELLAGHTRMSVNQAVQETPVEPNHVYIIPPDTSMTIKDGVLRLVPRGDSRGLHLPIDLFLCSLAEDRKSRSIGVILSGSASDGTIGLKAIKSVGGITFAQDDSAKFDSMPRNATAAGVVDFILPPSSIARELSNIARHSYVGGAPDSPLLDDAPVLLKIIGLLRQVKAVDFTHYKRPTLKRRLARRMALHHKSDPVAYLEMLEQDPGELNALFDDVLINVTEFFRNPETFKVLSEKVFPIIFKDRKPEDTIRVWVPGCSSGEEVYSIAICLVEYLERTHQSLAIQIFGTDISDRAVELARAGKYPDSITAGVSPERLDNFFIPLERGGYQVARVLRELCVFSRQDLIKDPPLSRMDLISCRNVLIYLGSILQRRVIATFSYALQPKGCLVLGNSENVGSHDNHLTALDRDHKIYARNLQIAPPLVNSESTAARAAIAMVPTPPKTEDTVLVMDREADRLISEEYGPCGLLIDANCQVVKFRGNVGFYIAPQTGTATLDVFKLVREDLVTTLRTAIDEVTARNMPIRKDRVKLKQNDRLQVVNILVRPISRPGTSRYFLVLFEEEIRETNEVSTQHRNQLFLIPNEIDLAGELATTRTYLQSLIEELHTANEESQSANEELQSTNEELQTAKEELQSSNEELTTTNDEMKSRNMELSQVNNDLLNLLSSMQLPVVMLNKDLRIRRFTPMSEKVLNLIPSDIGRPISDLKPRINVPNLEQLLAKVIYSLQALEQEVQDQDGHWYSLRINPYQVSGNRVDGAVLQLLDIDQLKHTVEAAEHARNYSEAIFATVREPLVVLDSDLKVETANQSFFECFGVSPEETLRCSIFEIGNRQWDFPKVHQLLDDIVSGGKRLQDVEIEHNIQNVGWRTFQLNARLLKRGGVVGQILLALEDVSDRKKTAEAKYRRLFETAKDGILIIDPDSGEITDANAFIVELSGFSREEVLGKKFWESGPLSEVRQAEEVLGKLRNEEIVKLPDVPLRTKTGRGVEVEIIGNIYLEGEKRVVQFNIRDITDRKQFDRKLLQSAKLESLGLLAGGVAHDFNNLLTGIMGNASLILDEAPPDTPDRERLRSIVKATQKAADLTRQMLAYSGRGRFTVGLVDVSELVREISGLIRGSIPKTVDVSLELASGLLPMQADSTQIQQIIMNLVINGAESIGEGKRGVVCVKTSQIQLDEQFIRNELFGQDVSPGTYVCLEVKDNGSGMDEATQAKIFDPFFTTKFTGRGLGLAATSGIVRGHSAGIRVNSALGQGTTFRVFFPAVQAVTLPSRVEPAGEDLHGSGLVLVVDDEELVLQLAKSALRSHGYRVLTAPNGEVAVRLVSENYKQLALIILDLTMPVMSGGEAYLQIKQIRPDIPIVLSSGYDEAQAVEQFGEKDLAGFVQKPYLISQLLKVVKSAVRK